MALQLMPRACSQCSGEEIGFPLHTPLSLQADLLEPCKGSPVCLKSLFSSSGSPALLSFASSPVVLCLLLGESGALGLTLLLKDFALILFSSWGEQKSLKQPKIIGKIGGENFYPSGSPCLKQFRGGGGG